MIHAEGADRLACALTPYFLAAPRVVLLAVSGGPDSTALMHAAASAAPKTSLAVATVDHGLRPDSVREAEDVGRLAEALGLGHTVLRWSTRPRGGLQAQARAARYRLLAAHAAAIGADLVLTAHTADDQAETVLMRLVAGSGPRGLAGMARERPLSGGIRLARPFLDIPKAELVAYCEANALPFATDPSNTNDRFTRARLRALMLPLSAEGLTRERLTRLANRLARDETALSRAARDLLDTATRPGAVGTLALDGGSLLAAPEAITLRMLDHAIASLQPDAQRATPHRLERLERLVLDDLLPALAQGTRVRRTLRGTLVETTPAGLVVIALAPPRRSPGTAARAVTTR
ncbi:tRNA lysidine(34) synthetase TilS [Methylobacterium sp. C25]|uniref:tRNA lysidine(34) synthetase TilS n=1 Tax=Methylobacterium sp. C25 TaxID=2721622 RepID=UPI001F35E8D5|nr:tRNA lysidine(34) synthetase TilS [Methylobacterium sp. C25]